MSGPSFVEGGYMSFMQQTVYNGAVFRLGCYLAFSPFDQAWRDELRWFQSDMALGISCLGMIAITLERSNKILLEELTDRQQQPRK